MIPSDINRVITSLLPGDEFYINNWLSPMVVAGRSRHFIVAYNPHFRDKDNAYEYTVIPIPTSVHAPVPECGPDDWIFGYHANSSTVEFYDFKNPAWVAEYLASFESGESKISCRRSAPIKRIYKSKEWLNG